MRVLLVHNFYGSDAPSGENQVFESERELLVAHGHDVETLVRHSDDLRRAGAWGTLRGALATPWNPWSAAAVRRAVDAFSPDVVHVHNTFPLLSPAIFRAIGQRAARVLTLHNYRLFCPNAIPMRAGHVCTECLDRHSVLPALRHGCYRGSRAATLPLAVGVALHRLIGTWRKEVDAFIALTEFQKELLVAAGLPAGRVHVKPNFFPGSPEPLPWGARGDYAVVAGRLSAEKGVDTVVRAWGRWGAAAPPLQVIGDGPLREPLEQLAADGASPVRFLGRLPRTEAVRCIAGARLLLLASRCFEGFPAVLAEAFAFGTPAAVSNVGPLPSIVRDGESGLVFDVDDPGSLLRSVRRAWETPGFLERLAHGARRAYEMRYAQESNLASLLGVYALASRVSRARTG